MKPILPLAMAVLLTAACDRTPAYDATGFFEATTVTVPAETAGKIIALGVDEGDSIIAGQQLGQIDTALLALQYRQLGSQQAATEKSSPDIAAQAAALRAQIAHQQNECHRLARR